MIFQQKYSEPICILAGVFLFWLAAFFLFGKVGMPEEMDRLRDPALYACLCLACLLVFARRHPGMRLALFGLCAFCIGGALLLRFCLIPHISRDMSKFLLPWVNAMAAAPGAQGLALDIGSNYNVPYMTLLWIISRIPGSPVFYIKLASIAFDLLAAFTMEQLAGYFCGNEKRRMLLAFFLTLFLPTLLLNSACWGQCDSIYAALGLGALYYGLLGRSRLCWCFLGLSFAVKMQAVFLFPLILVLVILKKISGKDSIFFFLSYLLSQRPRPARRGSEGTPVHEQR